VGFIRNLPKDLVNAFKATLEELSESDLVLHVLDASDPQVNDKRLAVEGILAELGLDELPRLVVLNKADETPRPMVSVLRRVTGGVPVSALKKDNLDTLMEEIEAHLFRGKPLPVPELPDAPRDLTALAVDAVF
jgi:GTP-binding protein HflX